LKGNVVVGPRGAPCGCTLLTGAMNFKLIHVSARRMNVY
jgi:hypothetical protein